MNKPIFSLCLRYPRTRSVIYESINSFAPCAAALAEEKSGLIPSTGRYWWVGLVTTFGGLRVRLRRGWAQNDWVNHCCEVDLVRVPFRDHTQQGQAIAPALPAYSPSMAIMLRLSLHGCIYGGSRNGSLARAAGLKTYSQITKTKPQNSTPIHIRFIGIIPPSP